MTALQLVSSPGDSYARAVTGALEGANSFVLVTGFASVRGVASVAERIGQVLARGGQGRIILAVDRQGFNAAAVFEALLALKKAHGTRLSIGLVMEESGLLHAKALFTQGPRGDQLVVGSANLTRAALSTNHELGVLLGDAPSDIRQAFLRFVGSIAPRSLDGPEARTFLERLGLVPVPKPPGHRSPAGAPGPSIAAVMVRLPALPPLSIEPEAHLAEWVRRGYLVGRGRRSLDALVLRLPQEQLVKHGYTRAPARQTIGLASHETRTMGYGIDLVPTEHSEALRRDARRVSMLLARLTLNLPCFGLWMPESYWEVFLAARDVLRSAHSLSPEHVAQVAAQQRARLEAGGLEVEIDRILDRLQQQDLVVPGRRDALRAFVLPRFQRELALRTPEMLASCIEFRTARQRWSPYDQTEGPYRQLMVDVVQATFAATYRTGDWPRRILSLAARELERAIAQQVEAAGGGADGALAAELLDQASSWENSERSMESVVEEFRRFVPDDLSFPPPDVDGLTGADEQEEELTEEADGLR